MKLKQKIHPLFKLVLKINLTFADIFNSFILIHSALIVAAHFDISNVYFICICASFKPIFY